MENICEKISAKFQPDRIDLFEAGARFSIFIKFDFWKHGEYKLFKISSVDIVSFNKRFQNASSHRPNPGNDFPLLQWVAATYENV